REHTEWSRQALDNIDIPKNFIIESQPRNTAAAIAFAALSLDEEDVMVITPSDHLMEDQKQYEEAIKSAIELAQKNYIVTFGIIPTKPETGYGYIDYKDDNVLSFREKPDTDTAQ